MAFQDNLTRFIQGRFGRTDLDQNILTAFISLNHFDQTANLPLDSLKAIYDGFDIYTLIDVYAPSFNC